MRTIKHQETTYNALHHCLEAHFGERHAARPSSHWKYQEPKQGLRTVPFQSLPLQLDYMQRRKPSAHRFAQITDLFINRNPFA